MDVGASMPLTTVTGASFQQRTKIILVSKEEAMLDYIKGKKTHSSNKEYPVTRWPFAQTWALKFWGPEPSCCKTRWHLRPALLAWGTSSIMPELTTEAKGHTSKSDDNFDYIAANSREKPYLCLPCQKSCSARQASLAITSLRRKLSQTRIYWFHFSQNSILLYCEMHHSHTVERTEQSNTVVYSDSLAVAVEKRRKDKW